MIGRLIRTGAFVGLSVAAFTAANAFFRNREEDEEGTSPIRDAGPDCMKDPPHRWDMTDEAADESFPASDPPGGY